MSVKAADLIKALMRMGMMVTINQAIDRDTAMLVVEEMGHTPVMESEEDIEADILSTVEEQVHGEAEPRPPVVTIMGHVDHGKTSLLDFIRETRVAAGEAGGITQHIGAYHVKTEKGVVTFLDTPGHAAFSPCAPAARRSRTSWSCGRSGRRRHAADRRGDPPRPCVEGADRRRREQDRQARRTADKVMQELLQHEVVPEEWGGDTQVVKVSAKTGVGIDALLDAILIQSELLELIGAHQGCGTRRDHRVEPRSRAGPVRRSSSSSGTLQRGDVIVTARSTGGVRAMFDEQGKPVKSAGVDSRPGARPVGARTRATRSS